MSVYVCESTRSCECIRVMCLRDMYVCVYVCVCVMYVCVCGMVWPYQYVCVCVIASEYLCVGETESIICMFVCVSVRL